MPSDFHLLFVSWIGGGGRELKGFLGDGILGSVEGFVGGFFVDWSV